MPIPFIPMITFVVGSITGSLATIKVTENKINKERIMKI